MSARSSDPAKPSPSEGARVLRDPADVHAIHNVREEVLALCRAFPVY
jgi:hypothetical protein